MTIKMTIKQPQGYKEGRIGFTKLAISFDNELWKNIMAQAMQENKAFPDMVLELCRVGLLSLNESDAMEVKANRG